jgi:NADH-quinone oxidoreductase subunit G
MENNDATLLIGSWLRKDQPLLNHRVRNSVLNGGAVLAINPVAYDFNYELDVDVVCPPAEMVLELAGIAEALGASTEGVAVSVDVAHRTAADLLKQAEQGAVILGTAAMMHPDFSLLRRLAANIAQAAGIDWGVVGFGANDSGAWLAGAVPHRRADGVPAQGRSAHEICDGACDTLLLLGCEPEADLADPLGGTQAMGGARAIAMSAHSSPLLEELADIILPIGAFGETSGTYVNLQGDVQSFAGALTPPGEARPAWKVLRVLGNLIDAEGFEHNDSTEVRDEVLGLCGTVTPDNALQEHADAGLPVFRPQGLQRIGGVPMYSVDAITRRSAPLQATPDAWDGHMRMNTALATALSLDDGARACLTQGDASVLLPVRIDDGVADNCVWLPAGVPESAGLGCSFAEVSVEKA